jgi:CRP-like cAMP-binding protein
MLSPLSGPILERLAGGISRMTLPAGSIAVREGDPGDRFYIIEAGRCDVSVNGQVVRRLGPGEGFGEIALVRDVPRTATVIVVEDAVLLGIDRGPFVDALGGQARSRTIASVLVDDRLAADVARS